ncbi:TPA: hypothetical protein EYP66_22230 [Candidatus Poribacteria bacterium]|nr:hypothetical protein [Candidatus Poribacteria bacterium]
MLLFLLILYLYSHSWNTQILLKQALLAILSGIITGMLALTWAGVGLLTTIIVVDMTSGKMEKPSNLPSLPQKSFLIFPFDFFMRLIKKGTS